MSTSDPPGEDPRGGTSAIPPMAADDLAGSSPPVRGASAASVQSLKSLGVGKDAVDKVEAAFAGKSSSEFSSAAFAGIGRTASTPTKPYAQYIESLIDAKYRVGSRAHRRAPLPEWHRQIAIAWAATQSPVQPGRPRLLSCCDELLALELAHALLDASDVQVLDPILASGRISLLGTWLCDELPALEQGAIIVNAGTRGVSDFEWKGFPSSLPPGTEHLRMVIICEHSGEGGRDWYDGLEAFSTDPPGPVQVVDVDDRELVLDAIERANLFGTTDELLARNAWEQLQQQVDGGLWRYRDRARGWKAVLWLARTSTDEFSLQFKRVVEVAARRSRGDEAERREGFDRKALTWLRSEDLRVRQIVILAAYFTEVSAGAFIDLCHQVCQPLAGRQLSSRRRQASDRIDDQLFQQCGLRYESMPDRGVVLTWDEEQADAVELAIDRHAVLARSELLSRLSDLGVAGSPHTGLRNGFLRLFSVVCSVDRADLPRMASRLCQLAAPESSGPVFKGETGPRIEGLRLFVEAYKQILKDLELAAEGKFSRLLLIESISQLWHSTSASYQDGDLVRPAVRVIAEVYWEDLEQDDLRTFFPPPRAVDCEAKAAEFLHDVFESSFFGRQQRGPMRRATALRRAEALARQCIVGPLADGSIKVVEFPLADASQHAFLCAFFLRLLTWSVLKDVAFDKDEDDDDVISLQLWSSPGDVGDVVLRALLRVMVSAPAHDIAGDGLMQSDPRLQALWCFLRFHLVAEAMTDASAVGDYRDAFLGVALVQMAGVQNIRGSVLLGQAWFWNHALRSELKSDPLYGQVVELDRRLRQILDALPVLLLRQLLLMRNTKEDPSAWERHVPAVKDLLGGDGESLRSLIRQVEAANESLTRFQAAARLVLKDVPVAPATRARVADRIASTTAGLSDLAILLRRQL